MNLTHTPPTWQAWTRANRKAATAEPVAWCEWVNHQGRTLCARPAARDGLCKGHRMVAAKVGKAVARAE